MSTHDTEDTLVYLDPNDISEPEITNVRPWSSTHGDTETEIQAIEALMRSIATEGQLQTGKVMKVANPAAGEAPYMLIAGRRRRRAILMYNLALAEGKQPLKFAVTLAAEDLKAPKMFRQAAHENLQRAGLSPMDFAMDCGLVRTKFKWEGKAGTKKVADFFEVSPAYVTEHEKLLGLPEDVQTKVHNGELSRDDAFKLAKIAEAAEKETPGSGAAVASAVAKEAVEAGKAVERAAEELTGPSSSEGPAAGAASERTEAGTAAPKAGTAAPKAGKKKAAKKKAAAAKSKVIKGKLREIDPDKSKARSKKEILEFFEGCKGPVYGHANGAVHQFVDNLLKYAAGEIQDRTLEKYFDAMVDKAPKGTPAPKVETAPADDKGKATATPPAKKKAAKKK